MTIRLQDGHFTFPTCEYMEDMGDWTVGSVRKYRDWALARGITVPHPIEVRYQSIQSAEQKPPKRRSNQSLNQYRRELRKWRIQKHGSISKKRASTKAYQAKVQRWSVLMDQGVPVPDPEAMIWLMKKNMFKKETYNNSYTSYLRESALIAAAGGKLPPGIDYSAEFHRIMDPALVKRHERQGMVRLRAVEKKPAKPMERWAPKIMQAAREAYRTAEFRHKLEDRGVDIEVSLLNGPYMTPSIAHVERQYSRRRGGKKTEAVIKLPTIWYRTVYLAGLANAFGPRTFVLRAFRTADGQRTRIDLLTQPGAKRYAITTVHGYLTRDINGNPKFTEE